MNTIWARQALTEHGWQHNVRITIDGNGKIIAIQHDQQAQGQQVGILLPAPVNAHSHVFQRALAGLTEQRGPTSNADSKDSFWTWRQLMYRFLQQLQPEQLEAIAAYVQMEMLEAGYACNVEFHYLHHQVDGKPYDRLAEMSERICAATTQTGIGLTLLPVYYQFGGCDGRALNQNQRRFGNTPDSFAKLFQQAQDAVSTLPDDAQIGIAPHSLRAISPAGLKHIINLVAKQPIHLHLAEQIAEVTEVQTTWGKRPVEWLLDNIEVG